MFAIQSGSKFVNADYFRVTDVYNFTVSNSPEIIKSKKDADTLFASVNKYLTKSVTWHKNHIAKIEAAITKADQRAQFLRDKVSELAKKSYKEVGPQIERALDEIERCEETADNEKFNLKIFRRELARLEAVQRQGIKMIKFTAVPVE